MWSLGDRKQTWALWLSRLIVLRECPGRSGGQTQAVGPVNSWVVVTEMGAWLEFIGQLAWESHTERSAEGLQRASLTYSAKDTANNVACLWGNYTRPERTLAERIQKNSALSLKHDQKQCLFHQSNWKPHDWQGTGQSTQRVLALHSCSN